MQKESPRPLFPCSQCGLCCKNIGKVVANARAARSPDAITAEIAAFPHPAREDGSCSQLQPDNTCAVYATRPDICNVEKVWAKHHSDRVPREKYFQLSEQACRMLQAGLKI